MQKQSSSSIDNTAKTNSTNSSSTIPTCMKLESLKSETKFTDNRIIVKCTGSYTIQSVTLNVHEARKSKSVKVLNLYYNNRPEADFSELKKNRSLWKCAKSCHLTFNQTELKVEFPVPITACNFMIQLDSFYENLQALSLELFLCPRCSRPVTDKHGICGNCHENAYQCRQCRIINYENLDSFLCNKCGYSKYGRFEFNFMAKPSLIFDSMENDEDMKRGLAAIESESENAHRRYQQLLGFKKPFLNIVSSIGENEIDSQQKDSLPGLSCKMNSKIALLGVLYGEKCKAACNSVSKSVKTLQGLRQVLAMVFLFSFLLLSKTVDAQSCEATMGLLRPCFGYVAAPPFGGSTIPSELCCDSFRHSYRVGDERCLCHLLMKTSPITIEADRVFQLDQICRTKQSLRKLCENVPLSAPPPPPPPVTPPLRPWTQITPSPAAPPRRQRTRFTVVLATTLFLGIVAFSLFGWIMHDLYRARRHTLTHVI